MARLGSRMALVAIVLAPLAYVACVVAFSVNVPVGDDYAMLRSVNDFRAASGAREKLDVLVAPHNEHRLVTTRAIMLLYAALTGAVDFRVLSLIGNAALLAALVVLGRTLGRPDDPLKWALLLLIVLQPQMSKPMFYPIAAVQAFGGLLFSLLLLRAALRDAGWARILLWYVLAVLTSASGIFLGVLVIPILLSRRRRRAALLHALVSLAVVALYAPRATGMHDLLERPMGVAQFFLLLLGSVAQVPWSGMTQLVVGASLIGYFLYLGVTELLFAPPGGRLSDRVGMLWILLYLLMMIGLIAIGRVGIYEDKLWRASLDGRYRVYSLIFTALCCADLLGRLTRRERAPAAIPAIATMLALVFSLGWYVHSFPYMRADARSREAAMRQWLADGDVSGLPLMASAPESARQTLTIAVSTGAYRP